MSNSTITQESVHTAFGEERTTLKTVMSGSLASGVAGGGAIVVAILGLAGVIPELMACIATIALGASMLFESGSVATRFSTLLQETTSGRTIESAELGSGMTAELLGGTGGIALGILSLLGVVPYILVPVAALLFGGSLILGSGVTARLNAIDVTWHEENETARRVVHEAVAASAGVQVLIGLGTATLGVLALVGITPLTLSLVALLGVGFADLMSGSAIGGKMLGLVRH